MTRDEIVELLSFYANGTLTDDDAAAVEAALAEDASLQDELDLLKSLRAHMQAEPVDSPGEVGLSQLMDKIEKTTPANLPGPPRFWQVAAGILLAVALVQGAFLVSPTGDVGPYRLAGDAEEAITVSFQSDVTEADLRAALLSAGLVIVDGPSALGLYGLAPLDDVDLEDARERLRETGIVESLQ